jgi:hypothetical protein
MPTEDKQKKKDFSPRYANSLMGLKVPAARVIALRRYGKNTPRKKQIGITRKNPNIRKVSREGQM